MKEMIKQVRERREGFTMAELLIVVAIIAVLVAIAIPVFTSQLEKSAESADLANIRSAYAEASAKVLDSQSSATVSTVAMTQGTSGWAYAKDANIGGYKTASTAASASKMPAIKKGDTVQVTVTKDGKVSIKKR